MQHEAGLIATIAFALGFAVVGGFVAVRLGLPPLVGYLLAGIAVGPFTPGFVADPALARQLAELGVILLMFGVGIHFSLRDLLAVRRIAVPGAMVQIATTTALALGASVLLGFDVMSGLIIGLAVSVASTVVLIRSLLERGLIDSIHGRVAVGWLIVQDLFIVVVLVLLPALAAVAEGSAPGAEPIAMTLGLTVVRVVALGLLMFLVGVRLIPWLLEHVARSGSRELFTLCVLALAFGLAFGSAQIFGVSFALGAFLAGAAISESDLSHEAAAQALPLRDAFAVLFFVSVGMLFDPTFLLAAPLAIAAILGIIVICNGLVALAIVLVLGYSLRTGLVVAVGLAQIGEFSFLLSDLGLRLGLTTPAGHNLILAVAILSITLNSFLFRALDPIERWLRRSALAERLAARGPTFVADVEHAPERRGFALLCGYGRVGSVVAEALNKRGFSVVVVDLDRRKVESLRRTGADAIYGDAANPALLIHLGLERARVLVIAISDPAAARRIVAVAHQLRPELDIVVRTHSEDEWRHLRSDRTEAVLGEREIAIQLTVHALRRFGVSGSEILHITAGLRRL
jgi:CPA2 family monovalent cation:H+ antiporter-2